VQLNLGHTSKGELDVGWLPTGPDNALYIVRQGSGGVSGTVMAFNRQSPRT
jgi:hypothetical protein